MVGREVSLADVGWADVGEGVVKAGACYVGLREGA